MQSKRRQTCKNKKKDKPAKWEESGQTGMQRQTAFSLGPLELLLAEN